MQATYVVPYNPLLKPKICVKFYVLFSVPLVLLLTYYFNHLIYFKNCDGAVYHVWHPFTIYYRLSLTEIRVIAGWYQTNRAQMARVDPPGGHACISKDNSEYCYEHSSQDNTVMSSQDNTVTSSRNIFFKSGFEIASRRRFTDNSLLLATNRPIDTPTAVLPFTPPHPYFMYWQLFVSCFTIFAQLIFTYFILISTISESLCLLRKKRSLLYYFCFISC